ncbi:WD40 repeat-like protein [Suillus weaverae]|nr:WD40 repeat-like protein [Suillus weaverae]
MNFETKIMGHPAPAMQGTSLTMPYREIKVKDDIGHTLHLPVRQQIITYSVDDGSFRVWDLERGTQVGEEWEDKERAVSVIALSLDGKTVASGSFDGTVRLWNIDTGKVIKKWTGHTKSVISVCWSPDGGRVVSGSKEDTFRVWDVKSGETIIGPINTRNDVQTVCYSPDGKIIATGGFMGLKVWDANTGELLKTLDGLFLSLVWTSDGKTLIAAGGARGIRKFETAAWSQTAILEDLQDPYTILLSPNERILASTSLDATVQLWNLETNLPIGTPLCHEEYVNCTSFSADGKFLATICNEGHISTWDISTIVKEAGLVGLLDIADVTLRPTPKVKGPRRLPPGFFNDALREANSHTRLSQPNGPSNRPNPPPHQRAHSRFYSFWRRSKPHRATQPDNQPRSQSLSWTQNLSGMLRRRDGSDIQLREVEVPYTAGKPRNYHARKKKPATSSSRPPNTHTTQQPSAATQSTPSSSQQPPPATAATTPTPSAAVGTVGTTGTVSHPHITGGGWRARFVGWLCCMPIQNTNGQP